MLFAAKLAELTRHLDHMDAEWNRVAASAYPNLAERLRLRRGLIPMLKAKVADLETKLAQYRPAADPTLDTWPQLFQELRDLAEAVHGTRLKELPAYQAWTREDHYVANFLETMHREVGLSGIWPVASLHQPHWFATLSAPPSHPIYFLPSSYEVSPLEIALVYHELGHVLYRLWSPIFSGTVDAFIASHLQRKTREANGFFQPDQRRGALEILGWWRSRYQHEMEETACRCRRRSPRWACFCQRHDRGAHGPPAISLCP